MTERKNTVLDVITHRRSIYPKDYTNEEIDKETIMDLLAAAHTAPTHKRTQPWRFIVFRGEGKKKLADSIEAMYTESTDPEKYSDKKVEDLRSKALQSNAVIMIIIRYSGAVPAWEEVAATGAAVQNLWLSAVSHNIGGYWSSPGLIAQAKNHYNLQDNEECLGFFYMGHHRNEPQLANRVPVEEKITWEE